MWAHGPERGEIARGWPDEDGTFGSRSPAAIPPIRRWSPHRSWPRPLWSTGQPVGSWVSGSTTAADHDHLRVRQVRLLQSRSASVGYGALATFAGVRYGPQSVRVRQPPGGWPSRALPTEKARSVIRSVACERARSTSQRRRASGLARPRCFRGGPAASRRTPSPRAPTRYGKPRVRRPGDGRSRQWPRRVKPTEYPVLVNDFVSSLSCLISYLDGTAHRPAGPRKAEPAQACRRCLAELPRTPAGPWTRRHLGPDEPRASPSIGRGESSQSSHGQLQPARPQMGRPQACQQLAIGAQFVRGQALEVSPSLPRLG